MKIFKLFFNCEVLLESLKFPLLSAYYGLAHVHLLRKLGVVVLIVENLFVRIAMLLCVP